MQATCLYNCAQIRYLTDIFDLLINRFVDDGVGIAEHFLSPALALYLKSNLTALYAGKMMLPLAQATTLSWFTTCYLEVIKFAGLTERTTTRMKMVFLI